MGYCIKPATAETVAGFNVVFGEQLPIFYIKKIARKYVSVPEVAPSS